MGAHTNQPINDNPNFVFDGKLKIFTLSLFALGVICLLVTYFIDSDHEHIRFWTNLLHNSVFFTGIAFAALFFITTHTVAWGGWQTIFKRIPEAMMMFLPVGLILMLVIAVLVSMDTGAEKSGLDFLYLWSDEGALGLVEGEEADELVQHKSAFLNPMNYFLTLAVVGIWALFAFMIRKFSIQQDGDRSLRKKNYQKIHIWSAIFLPIAGFSSAYAIWLWVMSVDPHWYSTLFAWYATVSLWVSAICLMFLIILFLRSRGHLQFFTKEHMHDLGKYIFGFSIFWTYLWFSQFMLIWYANNGEETQYFHLRFAQFPWIFYLNLFINFLLPFFALMMNSSKRAFGTMGFIAGMVLLGHWVDYYQMIKPGVWYNYEHAQHMKHDDHGHDGEHKEDAHHDGEHSDVYKLGEQNNTPKAVLTTYSDQTEDHEHPTDDTHGHDDANHDGDHDTDSTHVEEGDTTEAHVNHAPEEHDEEHGATAGTHGHDGEHGDAAHAAHDDHGHGHHTAFHLGIHFPGILELGTLIGFLGLFLFVTFSFLEKASLMPKNDPYVDESKHHHVWYDL